MSITNQEMIAEIERYGYRVRVIDDQWVIDDPLDDEQGLHLVADTLGEAYIEVYDIIHAAREATE